MTEYTTRGDDVERRRIKVERMTPAELEIRSAIHEVENVGADVRLTDAVVLLGAAQESVADYVDGVNRRRFVSADPGKWLIWSNEHRAWWCGDGHGYTTSRAKAGVYSMQDAINICVPPQFRGVGASLDKYVPPETMIPADL